MTKTTEAKNPYALRRNVGPILWYNGSTERVEVTHDDFASYREWDDQERWDKATVVLEPQGKHSGITAAGARKVLLQYVQQHPDIEFGYDDDCFRVSDDGNAANVSTCLPVAAFIEAFIDWYYQGGGYWQPGEVDKRVGLYLAASYLDGGIVTAPAHCPKCDRELSRTEQDAMRKLVQTTCLLCTEEPRWGRA